MSNEATAVRREKLQIGRSIGEGLQPLSRYWRSFALQMAMILAAAVALDLVPAFAFRMDSYLMSAQAAETLPLIISVPVWTARAIVPVWLAINLMFGAARAVLLAEPPALRRWFQWRRRQWQAVGILFLCLFFGLFGPGIISRVILLWFLSWLITVVPAVAIDDDFTKAWKISEGNRVTLFSISSFIVAMAFAAFASLRYSSSMIIGEASAASFVAPTAKLFAILLFCLVYAAVGAPIYRRLATAVSNSAAAPTPADSTGSSTA